MSRSLTVSSLLVTAAIAVGVAAAPAGAADAVLWACHGPSGQPLGAAPLQASAAGDGATSTYGVGCDGAGALADGGLRAAFTTADPADDSAASWQLQVPPAVTVHTIAVTRRTAGFGGTPVPGGGLTYTAITSTQTLESASVADASNVALSGTMTASTTDGFLRLGVTCAAAPSCAAPGTTPIGVDIGSVAFGVTDDSPPQGAVGGVTDPATGALSLSIRAVDSGLGLADATASLDGTEVATTMLGGVGCVPLTGGVAGTTNLSITAGCHATADDVPLSVPVTTVPDGPHRLTVVVRDAAGNATTVVDETITVDNTPPSQQSSQTLTIGTTSPGSGEGGGGGSGGGGGGGGVGGQGTPTSGGPVCLVPQLSMFLSQKPLRTSHGVAVLRRNGRYRFTGRLTCLVDGKRKGASTGTVIELLNVVRGRLSGKSGTTTRSDGSITIILAYPTSRTIEFRYRSVDGTISRVMIKVTIPAKPKPKPKRKHH